MLFEARGLKKWFQVPDKAAWFGHLQVQALDGVDLDLAEGEALGVVGESGCGKSTLARTLLRLEEPDQGSIRFKQGDWLALKGAALRRERAGLQMVFQDPYSSLDPRVRAWRTVTEALAYQQGGISVPARRAAAAALLDQVGLPASVLDRFPHEFSGGQRQRLSIARALASKPGLLVADEPVSSLDLSVQAQILSLLQRLQLQRNMALLFISHDLRAVRALCSRVMVMYLGHVVETAPSEALYTAPRHPYTRALLAAVPSSPLDAGHPSVPLQGEPPSPIHPPSGCRFHPRCPLAVERCRVEEPFLRTLEIGHQAACHLPLPAEGRDTPS